MRPFSTVAGRGDLGIGWVSGYYLKTPQMHAVLPLKSRGFKGIIVSFIRYFSTYLVGKYAKENHPRVFPILPTFMTMLNKDLSLTFNHTRPCLRKQNMYICIHHTDLLYITQISYCVLGIQEKTEELSLLLCKTNIKQRNVIYESHPRPTEC